MGATTSMETADASASSSPASTISEALSSSTFLTGVIGPDHPLYTLVHASPTPPTDPDASFYITLFREVASLKAAHPNLRPLTSLVRQALLTSTSCHATALSTSLRAAVFHIRQSLDDASSSSSSISSSSSSLHIVRQGAIQFALDSLEDLNRYAPSATVAYLAIAAGPAEAQLPTRDRIDLARALQSHLVQALLDLISTPCIPFSILRLSLPLLLLSLTDHLQPQQYDLSLIPLLPIRYASASSVVLKLLKTISDAAPYTKPDVQLATDVIPIQSMSAGNRSTFSTGAPDFLSVWDAFASSVATMNLKSKLTNMMNALSVVQDRKTNMPNDFNQHQKMPQHHQKHNLSEPREGYDEPSTAHLFGLPLPSLPAANNSLSQPKTTESSSSGELHGLGGPVLSKEQQVRLGEYALALLSVLCHCTYTATSTWTENEFALTLSHLQDEQCRFSQLYDTLSGWVAVPAGALLLYNLINYNRRFCTYVLARTDPDVIIAPLLASLRVRSAIGGTSADARIASCILLQLTSDAGLCAAINDITMPNSWLPKDLLFHHHQQQKKEVDDYSVITVNVAILAVCSRVVQQSVMNKRQRPDGYVATACLGVMCNVAKDVSYMPSVVAERVVGLVELLGRRRRKVLEEDGTARKKWLLELLGELIGMSLEAVVALLKDRATVAMNRHVVYAVMHREKGLQGEHVGGCSIKAQALTHMIGRMSRFFGDRVVDKRKHDEDGDRGGDGAEDSEGGVANGGGGRSRGRGWLGAAEDGAVSVERVFQVIEENGRWLDRRSVFDGVPSVTYQYRTGGSRAFMSVYTQCVATRVARLANQKGETSRHSRVFDVSR